MSELWQILITVISASGIIGTIVTVIVKKTIDHEYDKQERREALRDENMFLMMERVDNCAEMTHMMARKLHDAGVINGDLEELDTKNKKLNDKYEGNLRNLAMEVLRR